MQPAKNGIEIESGPAFGMQIVMPWLVRGVRPATSRCNGADKLKHRAQEQINIQLSMLRV
jgi:hypothetical protein